MSLMHCDTCDRVEDTDEYAEGVYDEQLGVYSCERCQKKWRDLVMDGEEALATGSEVQS